MRTKIAKWRRWHGHIAVELERLRIWRENWQDLTESAGLEPRDHAFVREVYAHALAMGIRRQMKTGSRVVSAVRLLADVADHPSLLPSKEGMEPVSPARVQRELAELRRLVRPAEAFADRAVAHADRRAGEEPPIEVLHVALDRLVALHRTWGSRLLG